MLSYYCWVCIEYSYKCYNSGFNAISLKYIRYALDLHCHCHWIWTAQCQIGHKKFGKVFFWTLCIYGSIIVEMIGTDANLVSVSMHVNDKY